MRINKLDLAKVISDFMFLGVENPEEKAKIVSKIKHQLTAHGFEKYMQYYFSKVRKYKVKLHGNTYEFDGGIDLKGIKNINGENHYLIVQCKKYSIKDITEDQIRSFHGGTFHKYHEYKDHTEAYYITTSKFTDKAEKFANEVHIKIVDFHDIYNLQRAYSIDQFKSDLKSEEGDKEYGKSFNSDQLLLELHEQTYEAIGVTDKEVFELLRQVRRDYSHQKQLRLGDIARNDTLQLLARKRPHNLEALKQVTSKLSSREKHKITKHGNIFIERLKYIHNEFQEKGIDIEYKHVRKKGFFESLIKFLK